MFVKQTQLKIPKEFSIAFASQTLPFMLSYFKNIDTQVNSYEQSKSKNIRMHADLIFCSHTLIFLDNFFLHHVLSYIWCLYQCTGNPPFHLVTRDPTVDFSPRGSGHCSVCLNLRISPGPSRSSKVGRNRKERECRNCWEVYSAIEQFWRGFQYYSRCDVRLKNLKKSDEMWMKILFLFFRKRRRFLKKKEEDFHPHVIFYRKQYGGNSSNCNLMSINELCSLVITC